MISKDEIIEFEENFMGNFRDRTIDLVELTELETVEKNDLRERIERMIFSFVEEQARDRKVSEAEYRMENR